MFIPSNRKTWFQQRDSWPCTNTMCSLTHVTWGAEIHMEHCPGFCCKSNSQCKTLLVDKLESNEIRIELMFQLWFNFDSVELATKPWGPNLAWEEFLISTSCFDSTISLELYVQPISNSILSSDSLDSCFISMLVGGMMSDLDWCASVILSPDNYSWQAPTPKLLIQEQVCGLCNSFVRTAENLQTP